MPITCTAGRARFFKPYCTARWTMVATLFQFSPYWRAVPCQLNSCASVATPFASDVVTRAQGSAQGKSSKHVNGDEIEVVTIPNADYRREEHWIVHLYPDTVFGTNRNDVG